MKRKASEIEKPASKFRKLSDFWKSAAQPSNVSDAESLTGTTKVVEVTDNNQLSNKHSDSASQNDASVLMSRSNKQSYKGFLLDVKEIQKKVGSDVLKIYHEKQKSKTRIMVKCLTCEDAEEEVRRFSSNGFVYMAHGVRCDGEKKLKDVIDHLNNLMHKRSLEIRKNKSQWTCQSEKHPWIRILKKQNASIINMLVKMATTCHCDSKLLTPTAWSWPCRSLAQEHAEHQIRVIEQEGVDAQFMPYEPNAKDMHYRDPITYHEMLSVVADLERKEICEALKSCIRYAVQMDGSVDSTQRDHKFVFIRYNTPDDPTNVETKFVAAKTSELRGSEALVDVFRTCMDTVGIEDSVLKKKFAGITTDGESANTGKNTGLWKRLELLVGHSLMNFWCACHRSDLAMEDIEIYLPEFKIWKTNLIAVATYFHSSAARTKELRSVHGTMKEFPTYHEVRFAQHLNKLCKSVLHNIDACLRLWANVEEDTERDRKEKQKARGFRDTWRQEGNQRRLTVLMADILSVFESFEKQLQKASLILPDILKHKDVAIMKLKQMKTEHYPGGYEEIFYERVTGTNAIETEEHDKDVRQTKKEHRFITNFYRNFNAIRSDCIQTSINAIENRLNDEQEGIVRSLIEICNATSPADFIRSARSLLPSTGIDTSETRAFADSVFETFDDWKPPTSILQKDYSARLYHMIR